MNSRFRQTTHGQEGQVVVIVLLVLLALLGLSAFVVDLGFVLRASNELQATANAAAEAGAIDLTNNLSAATAIADAKAYSMIPGSKNADPHVPNVSMVNSTPLVTCLSTIPGLTIVPSCGNVAGGNAIVVEEQASVSTFFGKMFGVNTINLTANALALMKGQGTPIPGNVVVIMDTTASMGNNDTESTCSTALRNEGFTGTITKLDCAKWGVRTLLMELAPCSPTLTNCGAITNGNVANPVSQVGLLTFPGLATNNPSTTSPDQVYEYDCQAVKLSTSNGIAPYAVPAWPPPSAPYYTIVKPSSDYRTSYASTTLYTSSDLVDAVYWYSNSGACSSTAKSGLQDPGGEGTYYAGIVTEASGDLSQIPAPRNSLQNAIIILSDGDANATSSDFTAAALKSNPNLDVNECQQAITAAQTAASKTNAVGLTTWVYTVAFGATTSGSCSTDGGKLSGCSTMQQMASDLTKFYSDDANGCVSPDHPSITSLGQIFAAIAYDFSSTRLLPFSLYTP